jgi:hypothetical protein
MPTGCRSALPNFTKADTLKDRTDGDLLRSSARVQIRCREWKRSWREKQRWDLINFLRATGGRVSEKSPPAGE